MAYTLDKIDVWAGTIEDRPGGLEEKLAALAAGGINLECVIARRQPDHPGTGVVFVAPIAGPAAGRVAKKAGLSKAEDMYSLRLSGPDKPGIAARISGMLAQAGINLRGFTGMALGRQSVIYFSFDSKDEANKAGKVLKKELNI
jgi:hypothetical protein